VCACVRVRARLPCARSVTLAPAQEGVWQAGKQARQTGHDPSRTQSSSAGGASGWGKRWGRGGGWRLGGGREVVGRGGAGMQCVRGVWKRAQRVCRLPFDMVPCACTCLRPVCSRLPSRSTHHPHHKHLHARKSPRAVCACTLPPGRYCSRDCQRAHWKGGHKRECDDLKTLRELQAEFAEMQGTHGFENYDPMHPPTMADISALSAHRADHPSARSVP